MLACEHCSKECKNTNSLRNHSRLCKLNPNRQESSFKVLKGRPSWNAGLTSETDHRVAEMSSKISLTMTGKPGKKHSPETREKMSLKKKELYASGWEPICGRCKKYDYTSPVAGTIKVDGTWELKVAKYLDTLGVKWSRNRKRFPYIKPDNKASTYQPDFFVDDWDTYIEVKGYETDLDRCKWSQFKEKLLVWKADKIQTMEG